MRSALGDWAERFATAIDSGLFHALSDDDRRRYVGGLSAVLATGGRLFLLCRGDEDAGTDGPRPVSRQELFDAFADGWEVESVRPSRFDANPESTGISTPSAWLAVSPTDFFLG